MLPRAGRVIGLQLRRTSIPVASSLFKRLLNRRVEDMDLPLRRFCFRTTLWPQSAKNSLSQHYNDTALAVSDGQKPSQQVRQPSI